ncbi:hypothetical protein F5888DRAFT_1639058 [Russula emetica]|nr:hypothetical protein F5888DRAFT_1639058 [Russula emetica]
MAVRSGPYWFLLSRICWLLGKLIQNIENLDRCTWPKRDVGEHVWLVRRWRDAQTTKEQETLFKDHGIRWSALLDLPYWNPILFTTIEPMHIFDAGLLQTHCWQVWGIDTAALSGDGLTPPSAMAASRPSDSELCKWYKVIRKLKKPEDLQERLKNCACDTLWHICSDNELHRAGNKCQLAEAIVEWTQHQTVSPDAIRLPVVCSTEPNQVAALSPASFIPQTEASDAESESQRSLEGSITTDDSMALMHTLQSAIDKCIKQLNDHASPKTVLQNELDHLRTKDELYAAAAAWRILERAGKLDLLPVPFSGRTLWKPFGQT